eukprot:COSAG02_NODE_1114_length_14502_cov_140.830035_12_plen_54_part_00
MPGFRGVTPGIRQPRYFLTPKLLAMALLLPGGHLGGLGASADGAGGSVEGASA